jgi:hypothetical protein
MLDRYTWKVCPSTGQSLALAVGQCMGMPSAASLFPCRTPYNNGSVKSSRFSPICHSVRFVTSIRTPSRTRLSASSRRASCTLLPKPATPATKSGPTRAQTYLPSQLKRISFSCRIRLRSALCPMTDHCGALASTSNGLWVYFDSAALARATARASLNVRRRKTNTGSARRPKLSLAIFWPANRTAALSS